MKKNIIKKIISVVAIFSLVASSSVYASTGNFGPEWFPDVQERITNWYISKNGNFDYLKVPFDGDIPISEARTPLTQEELLKAEDMMCRWPWHFDAGGKYTREELLTHHQEIKDFAAACGYSPSNRDIYGAIEFKLPSGYYFTIKTTYLFTTYEDIDENWGMYRVLAMKYDHGGAGDNIGNEDQHVLCPTLYELKLMLKYIAQVG